MVEIYHPSRRVNANVASDEFHVNYPEKSNTMFGSLRHVTYVESDPDSGFLLRTKNGAEKYTPTPPGTAVTWFNNEGEHKGVPNISKTRKR